MLEMDGESNGQVVLTALKQLGNELYTGSALSRTGIESPFLTLRVLKNKDNDVSILNTCTYNKIDPNRCNYD